MHPLQPIANKYEMVYGYDTPSGAWKRFEPGAPAFANSLTEMRSGEGHWIQVNEDCTLYFGETPPPTPIDTPTPTPTLTPDDDADGNSNRYVDRHADANTYTNTHTYLDAYTHSHGNADCYAHPDTDCNPQRHSYGDAYRTNSSMRHLDPEGRHVGRA